MQRETNQSDRVDAGLAGRAATKLAAEGCRRAEKGPDDHGRRLGSRGPRIDFGARIGKIGGEKRRRRATFIRDHAKWRREAEGRVGRNARPVISASFGLADQDDRIGDDHVIARSDAAIADFNSRSCCGRRLSARAAGCTVG